MKRVGFILAAFFLFVTPLFSQTVSIPDTAFLQALIEQGVDTSGDSLISQSEARAVNSLDVSRKQNSDQVEVKNLLIYITLQYY